MLVLTLILSLSFSPAPSFPFLPHPPSNTSPLTPPLPLPPSFLCLLHSYRPSQLCLTHHVPCAP